MSDDFRRTRISFDKVFISEQAETKADNKVDQSRSSAAAGIASEPDKLDTTSSLQDANRFLVGADVPFEPETLFKVNPDSVGEGEFISGSNAKLWLPDGVVLKTGKVQWDTIAFIKEKLTAPFTPGAGVEIMNALLQLDDADLAVTLKTLLESGPLDFRSLVYCLLGDRGSKYKMDDLLLKLGQVLPADALQGTFSNILSLIQDQTIIIDFLQQAEGQRILPNLNRQNITYIYNLLTDPTTVSDTLLLAHPTTVSGSLYASLVYKETDGLEPIHDPNVLWGVASPESLLPLAISDDYQDPNLAKALAAFPDRAASMLSEMEAKQPNFSYHLAAKLVNSKQDLGPLLAELCKRPQLSATVLTRMLEYLTQPFTPDKYGTDRSSTPLAPVADDQIRSMLSSLGNDAVKVLSQLSPLRLIEMKMILERGNDTAQNQTLIQNIIQPAYDVATS